MKSCFTLKKGEILNFAKERAEDEDAEAADAAEAAAALMIERMMVNGWKKRKEASVSCGGTSWKESV